MQACLGRLVCAVLLLGGLPSVSAAILFVDGRVAVCGDGQSWATAYKYLGEALAAARNSGGTITEIWVAGGTYKPDRNCATPEGSGNQNMFFPLVDGVAVRGGFAGNEEPATFDLNDRDFEANETVLSGDLAGNDGPDFTNREDNARYVVMATTLSASTTLDGFSVRGGWAAMGGGLTVKTSDMLVTNCTFIDNRASIRGGGVSIENCSPVFRNCLFVKNRAPNGGGLASLGGNPTLVNCSFYQNTSYGISCGGSVTFRNCIVWGNRTAQFGAILGTLDVTYCCVQGGWAGTGNISTDPRLLPTGRLRYGSACIDAGDNTALPESAGVDLAGHARFVDDPETVDTGNAGSSGKPAVDMGAFEYGPVQTERLYVSSIASGNADGSSWTNAHAFLQDAFKAADLRPGVTEIWVAQGTYKPDRDAAHPVGTSDRLTAFELPGGVKIYGGFPGQAGQEGDLSVRNPELHSTVLSGDLAGDDGPDFSNIAENSLNVLRAWGAGQSSLLDGFTITGGNATESGWTDGGGLLAMSSSPTVANCVFSGNTASVSGGGITASRGSLAVIGCKFVGNRVLGAGSSGGNGGAMSADLCQGATITNCWFSTNKALSGGGLYNNGSGTTVTNCTFTGNRGAGGAVYNKSTLVITNSIIWANKSPELSIYGGASTTVNYSCLASNVAGVGNIAADPRLLLDGHLRHGSACIDAGDNTALPALVGNDLAGHARLVDDPETPDTGKVGSSSLFAVDMGAFEYEPVPAERLYVSNSALVNGNGTSWASPYTFLQDAFKAAASRPGVTEIWVAQGTYKPDQDAAHSAGTGDRLATFEVPGGVLVYGGFEGVPGQEGDLSVRDQQTFLTVLSGDLAGDDMPDFAGNAENSLHVIKVSSVGQSTVLDGFTITAGNANDSGWIDGAGMVVMYSSPVISNCIFRDNSALASGGGMAAIESGIRAVHCKFLHNRAVGTPELGGGTGGGFATELSSGVNISGCLFSGNSATSGAGLYSGSGCEVTNCTFVGNTASSSGAGIYNFGSIVVTNTIVWANSGSSIVPGSSGATVSYSCVQGGFSGTGNIGSDPLFVNGQGGDLRLQVGSPCIDAGKNSAVPSWLDTDIIGLPRFFDYTGASDCRWAPGTCGTAPVVDIGVHEFVIMPGDFDDDYDVDGTDLSMFEACATGPAVALAADCSRADLDSDLDADAVDFGVFQRCISGEGRLGNVKCVD